jgi:hypothetical protein
MCADQAAYQRRDAQGQCATKEQNEYKARAKLEGSTRKNAKTGQSNQADEHERETAQSQVACAEMGMCMIKPESNIFNLSTRDEKSCGSLRRTGMIRQTRRA